ncbi:YdeI/OmpD-associated family protein [Emticicia fluvialis]|uniref:YdeI/OmpD-associated family protein n=1 Tax=Emticicia fluvialis TaxID=2974474 RepID=UPI002165F1BF|nr:YdeI/OmpD-associated family protein [Emticicia fluvialis]
MEIKFFAHELDFREWLEENHEKESELIVGFYKVDSGKPSLTWSESVDQALCFGWIDGVRRSVNHESYCIRFTPRKPGSNWSTVNINKMEEMIPKGLVKSAGLKAYHKRKEHKSNVYTYEQAEETFFTAEMEIIFQQNPPAWAFFQNQPPYYKKLMTRWVVSAKQKVTQSSRLEKLINACAKNERL